jgi:hypothetical protein
MTTHDNADYEKCPECGGNCNGAECGLHAAGCCYGGFSCGYWLVVDGCELEHHERHYVGADGRCPCGTLYPGAANCVVGFDATTEPAAS